MLFGRNNCKKVYKLLEKKGASLWTLAGHTRMAKYVVTHYNKRKKKCWFTV